MSSQPKISFEDVHLAFGPKQVLRGVDLAVDPGESLVIIGGSGSGKSVLIKTVLGITRPDKGVVAVDGEDIVGASARLRNTVNAKIGMLFQGGALFDSLPVWENVGFGLIQSGVMDRQQARVKAIDTLARVGLDEHVSTLLPVELSGGMQMRASIARAMVTEPNLLLMDEPFGALDEMTRNKLNDDVLKLWREKGWTIVFVTHSVYEAVYLSSRVVVMAARPGRIVDDIEIKEPYPRSPDFRVSTEFAGYCRQAPANPRATRAGT